MPILDIKTGDILITDTMDGRAIGPGTSRAAFLNSELGRESTHLDSIGTRHTYRVGVRALGNQKFFVAPFFEGDRLAGVELILDEPPGGDSWADWLEEDERQRHRNHGRVLHDQHLTGPWPWGTVERFWDSRNLSSSILVSYT